MAASLYEAKKIEGYLLSAANLAEAATWCGGTADAIAGTVTLDAEEGLFQAGIGQYITKDLQGRFYVWKPADFLALYGSEGSLAAPMPVVLDSDSVIAASASVVSSADAAADVTLGGGYFKAAVDTVDQPHVQIVGLLARASMAFDALDAYGLQSHLTLAAGAESAGNLTAISGKTILGGNNAGGIVSAGLFTVEGAFTPNTGYGVWIDDVDAQLDAGLEINCNNGRLAAGIKLDKMGTGAITRDIVLQNGESIDNATDGLINHVGNIGVAGVKVVGAQVAAIGLDAKTDTQKITDIIAALRAHGLLGPNA